MPQSVGGLYLQVKLQTDAVEADIRRLGKMYEQAFNGKNGVVASSGAAGNAVAAKNTSSVIVAGTKAQAKAEADYQKLLKQQEAILARVNAEQAASNKATMAAAIKAAQFRAQTNNASMAELQKQIQATGRAADAQVREARRGATAAISESNRVLAQVSRASAAQEAAAKRTADAQVRASKRAADAAVRDAKKAGSVSKALGAGSQELFVGLGAARSGNMFYGLAAGARYAKNLTAALGGASLALTAVTLGAAAAAIAVAAIGAAVVYSIAKIVEFGVTTAASFETLSLQFTGLLGSASRAKSEMDFLLGLGMESIVPTQALMEADRQMLAFGVTTDSTRRSLVKFISDFGTATTASANQIYFMGLALGQVAAQGRANSVDMRQLANAGIATRQIYKIIGKQIGVSAKEVRDGVGDGIVTADRLFAALSTYGARFASTAEAARNSTNGLLSNIADTVSTKLGIAFAGMNKQVGGALKEALAIIQQIDFSRIATSISAAFSAIGTLFGDTTVQGSWIIDFFNNKLPQAINLAAWTFTDFIRVLKIANDVYLLAFDAIKGTVQAIIWGWATVGLAATEVLDRVGLMSDEEGASQRAFWQGLQQSSAGSIAETVKNAKGQFAELRAEYEQPWYKSLYFVITPIQAQTNRMNALARDPNSGGNASWNPSFDAGAALQAQMDAAAAGGNVPGPKASGGSSGPSKAQQAALDSAKAWVEKYKKVLGDASSARDKFRELTRQPFGTPSEIQKGFGSGSVDTIISSYDNLRAAIADFYKPLTDAALVGKKAAAQGKADRKAAFDQLKSQASQLIALANDSSRIRDVKDASGWDRTLPNLDDWYSKESDRIKTELSNLDQWRSERETAINAMYDGLLNSANKSLDAATAKYEEANGKLSALIDERDSFLKSLTDSMRSFVNDLTLVETELQKYTRLDNAGSFMVETTKSTASFKDGLQSRLDALKSWTANIRKLMASGLDSSLIQQFVSAGVSGSADVVSQLAAGDSATITAVNDIQAQLAAETASFSSAASAQWFDAGVAQAEAYVVPLRSAMAAAQAEVARLDTMSRRRSPSRT
jgi:hypothetical protein